MQEFVKKVKIIQNKQLIQLALGLHIHIASARFSKLF